MLKKSISVLLAVIITLGVLAAVPVPASAAATTTDNNQSVGLSTDNVEVSGSNSLGSMLAEEYEENAETPENKGSGIYAVEVEGKTARVDVRALVEAQLIVSVFDEEGNTMYGSGMTDVSTDDSIVELTLEIDTMPQYFYIKAFLLDKSTNRPLCKQFESADYTQKMQEFLAKDTGDFEEEKVLNLDDNQNNNFLVYNDDTIIIENDDQNTNVVTKADDKTKEYVINNIDDSITALKPGDIFSYDFGDGLLIIKISTISINGTTATIHGDEMELKEAFDFIKIDTLSYGNDARYDSSNISDGIEPIESPKDSNEPVGADDNHSDSVGLAVADWDIEHSHELKFKFGEEKAVEEYYNSETSEHNELKKQMYGEFGVKLAVNLKFYYDEYVLGRDVEMSLTVKYEFSASLKAKISETKSSSLGLGGLFFEPVPGVTISITPSVVVSGKLKASFSVKFSGQIGFKYKNGQSEDLGKSPKLDFDIDFEGELFIGLSLEPKISILGDVAKAKAEGIAGLRIRGKTHPSTSLLPTDSEPSEKHLCTVCIEGDISLVLELNVELSLFNNADLTWKWNLVKAEWKLTDFYWSIDHAEFGFSTCPYREYKCTVTLLNPKKESIEGATVNGKTTDSSGKAVLYLQKKQNMLEIKKGDKTVTRSLYVNGTEKQTYVIDFDKPETALNGSSSGGSGTLVKSNRKVIKSGQCGNNVYYTLYEDGLLDITGTGEMYNAFSNNPPWYYNRDKVKKVNIGNSVTSISISAFDSCTGLTSFTIPDSVTRIGSFAFYSCTGLTSITIPDSVTSIGNMAFYNCTGLKAITVDGNNTVYDSRENCNAIIETKTNRLIQCCQNTSIPDSVTSIGNNAFHGCTELTSITIPDGVTSIGDSAFSGCMGLTSITIPDSVTRIGSSAFDGCKELTSITIPESVTIIDSSTFFGCKGITSITIPDSVTIIGSSAFSGCTGLTSITIPDSVTRIGSSAFSSCKELTSITIPESVTSVGDGAFRGTAWYNNQPDGLVYAGKVAYKYKETTPSNSTIEIKEGTKEITSFAFEGCKGITSITIPDSVTSSIPYKAFNGCTGLTNVIIGNGVTSIDDYAFYNCTGLTNVIIPNSVTSIGYNAFNGCTGLTNVIIGNGVTSIGSNAFHVCTELTSITIPDGVTSIGSSAFDGCTGLTSITIPNSVKSSIPYKAFNGCTGLTNVIIGNGVTCIDDYAFYNCTGLTNVIIPNSVTSIGSSAFQGCTGLTSITIPDSVTSIGDSAFQGCTGLTSITIGNGVTRIYDYTFLGCTGLISITIPCSVTSIDYKAFYKCKNLKNVFYSGSKEDWNKIKINSSNSELTNATIHYNSTATDAVGCNQPVEGNAIESVSATKNAAAPKAKQKPETIAVGADSGTGNEELNGFSRSHLVPETEAVLLIIKGTDDDAALDAQSLLYIAQGTVDDNGNISFDVKLDFGNENWVAFIFGECDHSSSKWTVAKEATQEEEGVKVLTCDHCSAVLDTETISALSDNTTYGDINGDNSVDVLDATVIQKYSVGKENLSEDQLEVADVNDDGVVDILDATLIQKYAVDKITEFKKK